VKNRLLVLLVFYFVCNITIYAQQRIFNLIYCEWPDGCLTYRANEHYHYNLSTGSSEHRNDTVFVNSLINDFNNYIRQFNAISIEQQRSGMVSDYVYRIDKSYKRTSGVYSSSMYSPGVIIPAEKYTMYSCNIYKYKTGGGYSSSSDSGSSGSSYAPSYNPANSNYLLIGYNFAYDAPFGLTIADSMFFKKSLIFISANFGFSNDPGRLVIEWIYGVAFSLTDWLRMPIGIGGNHIAKDGEKITGSSTINGHTTYHTDKDPLSEWEHAFVIEAGLQPVIKDRFYLSATYRLIGFSRSGFTIGAGIVF
jgi:hypothetical protein